MVPQVGAPLQMRTHMSFNSRELEELPMFGGGEGQGFLEQRPERSPEPVVRGNIETRFLSCEDSRREFAAHQAAQDYLLARTLDFQAGGERVREFDNSMVEKRRPHFDGMRHAGAIHLGQHVVREKVLLIEFEEVLQAAAHTCDDGIESRGQLRLNEGVPFPIAERPAPVNVGAGRGHQAAFEEAFQLVFESDLVVGYRQPPGGSEQRPKCGGRQSANPCRQQARPVHQVSAE